MLPNDFEKLKEAYTLREIENHQLHERVISLEEENERLKELLRLQQERLFGKKSEVSSAINPSPPDDDGEQALVEPKITTVASHVRTIPPRGKRQLDTSDLPRYNVTHDLPDAEKNCLCCGGELHVIRREKSEQLDLSGDGESLCHRSYTSPGTSPKR